MEEGRVKVKGDGELEDLRAGCQGYESDEPVRRGRGGARTPSPPICFLPCVSTRSWR